MCVCVEYKLQRQEITMATTAEVLERIDLSFDGGVIKEVYRRGEEGKIPAAGDEVSGAWLQQPSLSASDRTRLSLAAVLP